MTNTVILRDSLTSIGVFNKTVSFKAPIKLPQGGGNLVKVQCSAIHMPNRIPNVFDGTPYGINFDNRFVRVGTDLLPYQTIQLEPGLYLNGYILMQAINTAINDTLGWWLDPKIPGLTLVVNEIIDKFIIKIDSTKLNPAVGTQFYFDLREATTGSQMYSTLGFLPTTLFTVDGTYSSVAVPKIFTQGTTAMVNSSIMPARLINDDYQSLVAAVAFTPTVSATTIDWPKAGELSTTLVYSGPRIITQATFSVTTVDGNKMVFLDGPIIIEIAFYW